MIQIRKRWPILTAVVAALAYGANNYKIAGIENLRLEPRPQDAGQQVVQYGATAPSSIGFDYSQFGIRTGDPIGTGLTASPAPQRWPNQLTPGERLALLDLKSQNATGPRGSAQQYSYPTPIPSPPGLIPFPSSDVSSDAAKNFSSVINDANEVAQKLVPVVPLGNMVGAASAVNAKASRLTADSPRIRVASFNVRSLGPAKLAKPQVLELLVKILRQYDVVALQEIQSTRDDILPLLVERLNQSGQAYDYVIGPRVGRSNSRDQFAFVFDTATVETDRYQLYSVDDPEDLISMEPLVAWFRCKQVPASEAFTFSAVNLRIDPAFAAQEHALLPTLISAIERDGRGEDDWLLLGDFQASNSELPMLNSDSIRFAVRDIPTNVTGERMLDSILFSSRATTEFTGKAGAFDFLRKYNLSLERAMELSEHMPVWAEFSAYEGNEPGRVGESFDPAGVF